MKNSKQGVETLKKARSENVSESKESHVEKPDIVNTLEISDERDNENTLLTTSNYDGDYQPPLSKQKQFISPGKTFSTNPSFEHFVGRVVSKIVVECGKKFYFNDLSAYKVKPSCANPTPNEYANIRNINNQTLPHKLLDQSVGLQQLSRFGICNQSANALCKCTFLEDGRFKKDIAQTVQQFQIDERFEELKEISTAGRNRRLEPKWTELLNEFLHPLNCYCVWVFKKHYLRKSASRKSSPYFRCEATCKVEGCESRVKITINEKSDRFGRTLFFIIKLVL